MGLALRLPRLYTRDGDLAADRYFGGELFMTPAFSARVAGASPTSLRSRREDLAG